MAFLTSPTDAISAKPHRVHLDLVLAHEPTNRCHFGHAVHRCQSIAQIPVLVAPQVCKRSFWGVENVHEGPADAGGIGTELRGDACQEAGLESPDRYSSTRERAQ